MRAAIIENGKVVNTIVLPDGWPNVPNPWPAPEGCEVVESAAAGIGETYDGSRFDRAAKEGTPVTIDGLLAKPTLTNEELAMMVKDLYGRATKA